MNTALMTLSEHFNLLKLHITVQLKQDTQLPAFKGSMWHGLFGHVLHAYDHSLFSVFYDEHDKQQPKPYAIAPDGDHKTQWNKGELLTLRLSLFGQACQLADKVVDAWILATTQTQIGIGEQKSPFAVISISSSTPNGLTAGIETCNLANWLPLTIPSSSNKEIAMHFLTPMRIKQNGQILKQPINNLDGYLNQILRRLIQLSRFWVIELPELFDEIYTQTQQLKPHDYQITVNGYFEDWLRYSTRHEKQIPIGGFKGQISIYGKIAPLIPIFKLGEHLQIGGKTTFGLGHYQLIC